MTCATDIEVSVVLARAEAASTVTLRLAAGATLGEAVERSALIDGSGEPMRVFRFAIFGKLRPRHHVLCDGDRVEILRPLLVSPNEARLARAQGKKRRSSP